MRKGGSSGEWRISQEGGSSLMGWVGMRGALE